MKAIKNIESLQLIFEAESHLWQKDIYDKTGVILTFLGKSAILFSNCGYIDLDLDAEYKYVSGEDKTDYCEITCVDEIIEYILSMESYFRILKNESFGEFTKAELFWAIYSRVINAPQNKGESGECDWRLHSIHQYNGHTVINMDLIGCDDCEFWIDITSGMSLNEALDLFVKEMNSFIDNIPGVSTCGLYEEKAKIPQNYNELMSKSIPGNDFAWLIN